MAEKVTIGIANCGMATAAKCCLLPPVDLELTDPPYGIGLDYSETFKGFAR